MAPRTSRRSLIALAALLGMLIAGCGEDEPDRATSTTEPTTTEPTTTEPTTTEPTTTAAGPDVERFLLQADEVPDLAPTSTPQTGTGPPFDLPEEGTELLRHSGYISTTYQPAEGDRGAGVSSVLLFETAAGAREWMAYELSIKAIHHQIPGAEIERFQVPDVPGANGWTGPDLHGNSIGTVFWTQGRCMILIALEVEGPRVARLSAGAKAIYERTGGTCPG